MAVDDPVGPGAVRSPPAVALLDWSDGASLAAAAAALAVALLGPRLIPDTDPLGVDPFAVRLGVVSLVLVAATMFRPFRPFLAVQLAVAAVVLPFVLWSATPRAVSDWFPDWLGFRSSLLAANALYAVAALALALAALRAAGIRPLFREGLRAGPARWGAPAALLTVVVMVTVFLAIPATLVGRVAIPLAVLHRDLPLLGPAYVLQAVAQEIAFRGALLRILERAAPAWAANAGQSLLFGLAHIAVLYEGPVSTIVPITVALGFGLGWVTQRTRSLWPAVIAHAVLEVGQAYGVLPGIYGT